MLPLIYGFVLFSAQSWLVHSIPTKYDQRQEGDVNVQIDLKDVKIIALLKSDIFDDASYDYVYDYADFTLKPIVKPTTDPSGTSTSIKPTIASSTVSSLTIENETTEIASPTTSVVDVSKNQISENSTIPSGTNNEEPISTTEASLENPVLNQRQTRKCRKGFDKSGRCHRRRISLIPLAMKMAPELVRSVRKRISI